MDQRCIACSSVGVFNIGGTVAGYTVADAPELEGLSMPMIGTDAEQAHEIANAFRPVLQEIFRERFNSEFLARRSLSKPSRVLQYRNLQPGRSSREAGARERARCWRIPRGFGGRSHDDRLRKRSLALSIAAWWSAPSPGPCQHIARDGTRSARMFCLCRSGGGDPVRFRREFRHVGRTRS